MLKVVWLSIIVRPAFEKISNSMAIRPIIDAMWVFRPALVDSVVVDSAVVVGLLGAPLVSTIKYYTTFNFTSIG